MRYGEITDLKWKEPSVEVAEGEQGLDAAAVDEVDLYGHPDTAYNLEASKQSPARAVGAFDGRAEDVLVEIDGHLEASEGGEAAVS